MSVLSEEIKAAQNRVSAAYQAVYNNMSVGVEKTTTQNLTNLPAEIGKLPNGNLKLTGTSLMSPNSGLTYNAADAINKIRYVGSTLLDQYCHEAYINTYPDSPTAWTILYACYFKTKSFSQISNLIQDFDNDAYLKNNISMGFLLVINEDEELQFIPITDTSTRYHFHSGSYTIKRYANPFN